MQGSIRGSFKGISRDLEGFRVWALGISGFGGLGFRVWVWGFGGLRLRVLKA